MWLNIDGRRQKVNRSVECSRATARQRVFSQAISVVTGAPEGIRTPDLCLRRAALYPAELRARRGFLYRRLGEAAIARYLKGEGAGGSLGRSAPLRAAAQPAFFETATIMSSSTRAPGDDSWLMQIIVLAGSQSPK